MNCWYIDALIDSGGDTGVWRLTGFYGNSETYKRRESWEMLTRLEHVFDKLWMCIRDFNKVLSINEKEGMEDRSSQLIANFQQCLNSNGLKDLGFIGSWFTWEIDRTNYGYI